MNKAKSGLFKIIGINENYMGIKILKINEDGRYFNKGDDENTRNVTIIGENVSTTYLIIKKRWVSRSTLPVLILR